ncbi:hypothetical protein J4573_27615 [Actinomadura barringtoniae]|uniref:Uncharacterized protein n=1 Tax=Actinomadura barringtoniae TaxID=1427535 RepID=A0A939T5P9_9ACTN|nr:hypothetical protein [Actinomadura barringtoniae]MBO2450893.1 hypothetical protein [Actinomadura barringtoniae]
MPVKTARFLPVAALSAAMLSVTSPAMAATTQPVKPASPAKRTIAPCPLSIHYLLGKKQRRIRAISFLGHVECPIPVYMDGQAYLYHGKQKEANGRHFSSLVFAAESHGRYEYGRRRSTYRVKFVVTLTAQGNARWASLGTHCFRPSPFLVQTIRCIIYKNIKTK